MTAPNLDGIDASVRMRTQIPPAEPFDKSNRYIEPSFYASDTGGCENHAGPVSFESDIETRNDLNEYDLDASDSENERQLDQLQQTEISTATSGFPFISRTLSMR